MDNRVLLGFSGGTDSCASALRLRDEGYRVTAVTMDMTGDAPMVAHAREKAARLDVEWFCDDVRERFEREVVDDFARSYLAGQTPSPCVICNMRIKWRRLYELATRHGFGHIATGHYFRIAARNGKYYVARGADPAKDQSYYLWGLTQQVLRMALTPMGDRIKKNLALDAGLTARESMGVCFLHGADYGDFLRRRCGGFAEGDIVDMSGRVIGRHTGYPLYTVGQRRGVPGGLAVVQIDAARNRLIAGPPQALYTQKLAVRDFAAVDMDELLGSRDVSVKIRGIGRNPEGFCRVAEAGDTLEVALDAPAWAVAPGQPVVFYRGERVLGGGYLLQTNHPGV